MSDAIVIGGGSGGLVAAAYLARAGMGVTVLEASGATGGLCRDIRLDNGWLAPGVSHLLYALDPQVAKDLQLEKHGLHLIQQDLSLTGLWRDGRHLTLERNAKDSASRIQSFSDADAVAYAGFQREHLRLARSFRGLWWLGRRMNLDSDHLRLASTGAAAYLNGHFESDALKSLLAFDGTAGGLSVLEPGSALAILWRMAQEVGGQQGAVAVAETGAAGLSDTLMRAVLNERIELRLNTTASGILVDGEKVTGVELSTGEKLAAPLVLSSLPTEQTFALLPLGAAGLAPRRFRPAPTGEARLYLALSQMPAMKMAAVGTRFVVAEKTESLVSAHYAARAGRLPEEIPCEFILLPTPQGGAILSLLARPVPRTGWSQHAPNLVKRLLPVLETHMPGLRKAIQTLSLIPPYLHGPALPALRAGHMLATPRDRVETPVRGLYLCGASAEPVPSVSGCAARFAAMLGLTGAL